MTEKNEEIIKQHNDLDFEHRKVNEMIKVRNCTFTNNIKEKKKYYFCKCTPGEFYPICSACAQSCHKSHNPVISVEDNFTCMCGKSKHHVHEEEQSNELNQSNLNRTKCSFESFYNLTLHGGYYRIIEEDKIVCSLCLRHCHSTEPFEIDESEIEHYYPDTNTEGSICQCGSHRDMNNIFNLNFFNKRIDEHMINFNFNIFAKVKQTKELIIDMLVKKIVNHTENKNEDSYTFFSNVFILKILELFSDLNFNTNNPYFTTKDYIDEKHYDTLLELLATNTSHCGYFKLDKDRENYAFCKIYFAEFIFNMFIKKFFVMNGHKVNLSTFTNMNILQRFIHVYNVKKIHKDTFKEDYINRYSDILLDLYDSLMRLFSNAEVNDINQREHMFIQFLQVIFLGFNRIFKDLIKYNLITPKIKARYFELVRYTLYNFQRKQMECRYIVWNENCLYVVQSIFYSLVYTNDTSLLSEINDKHNLFFDPYADYNKKYAFITNDESNTYSYIFSSIINHYERSDKDNNKAYMRKLLKYDQYIRYIMDLMVGKNEFYLKGIENLKFLDKKSIEVISSNNIEDVIYRHTNTDVYRSIVRLSDSLDKINHDYLDYEIDYKGYIYGVNIILNEIKAFLTEYLSFDPVIVNISNKDQNMIRKISNLQEAIKYTNFYNVIDKMLYIYASDKRLISKYSYFKNDKYIHEQSVVIYTNLETLLAFLYISCDGSHENLVLLMGLDPRNLVLSFIDSKEENKNMNILLKFLGVIMNLLFSKTCSETNEYRIDNYIFYCNVVVEIIELNKLPDETNEDTNDTSTNNILNKYLYNIHMCMKLCTEPLKFVDIQNPELIDLIEVILSSLNEIKQNRLYKYLIKYLSGEQEDIPTDILDNVLLFLNSYFIFINGLIESDVYFLSFVKDKEYLLFDLDILKSNVIYNDSNTSLDVFLNQHALENYIKLTFHFNYKFEYTQDMIRLLYSTYKFETDKQFYFNDKNLSLIHLNDKELSEKTGVMDESETGDKRYLHVLMERGDFMLKVIKRFPDVLEKIEKTKTVNEGDNATIRSILLIFEKTIVRPLFALINHFLLYEQELKGNESYTIYDLTFSFLEKIIYLYESIDRIGKKKNNIIECMNLVDALSLNDLLSLKSDLISLTGRIKYFEIEQVVNIQRNAFKIIITNNNKTNKNKQNNNQDDFVDRIDNIFTNYKKTLKNSFEKKLSMIKSLNIGVHNICDDDLRLNILNYITMKFCDSLTHHQINKTSYYNSRSLGDIYSYSDLKLQNFYILDVLNNYFYHDSIGLQNTISNKWKADPFYISQYTNITSLMIKYFVFSNIVNECKLLYELDSLNENKAMSFELTTITLKFLLNLCANHNNDFQSMLFNLKFEIGEEPIMIKGQRGLVKNRNITTFGFLLKQTYTYGGNSIDRDSDKMSKEILETEPPGAGILKFKTLISPVVKKKASTEENNMSYIRKRTNTYSENNIEARLKNMPSLNDGEIRRLEELAKQKYMFLNFLFLQMKLVIKNLNFDENSLLYKNREVKNYDKIIKIFDNLFSLLLVMIQGTDNKNFELFYKKIPFLNLEEYLHENLEYFSFIRYAQDIRDLVYDDNILDDTSLDIKSSIFIIFNDLITQTLTDDSLILLSCSLFSMDELIQVISRYMRALYVKHVLRVDYKAPGFKSNYDNVELNEDSHSLLLASFAENEEFYNDNKFKLSSQIYLFITILSEKFHILKAKNVKDLANQDVIGYENIDQKAINKIRKAVNKSKVGQKEGQKPLKLIEKLMKVKSHNNPINNLIITSRFFNTIIKSCEFLIEDNDNLVVKYFIEDPRTYLISKENLDSFKENVNRSTPSTKLKSLIDYLPTFVTEVEYKYNYLKKDKKYKWMFELEYKRIDMLNILMSCLIIFILLMSLKGENYLEGVFYYIIYTLAGIQIVFNLICLYIFYKSKYRYYVTLETLKLNKKSITTAEFIQIHIIDSFLFNDETYLIILSILIASMTFVSRYATFLYTLQLYSISRFVPTINEILVAFKLRFGQFLSMIGFLAILINFYATFGFFFMRNEFEISLADVFIVYLYIGNG